MKTFSERAALLQRARRALRKAYGKPVRDEAEDIAPQLLRFILSEGSTRAAVDDAVRRIAEAFVDLNELRVSLAREIAEVIPKIPNAQAKAARLIKLFNAIFLRHNTMDWDFVRSMGVRELRQYFENVDGGDAVLGAAAVLLLSSGHAVPADTDVHRVILRLELVGPDEEIAAVQGFLERALKSDQGFETWALVRRLAEARCLAKAPLCGRCTLKAMCPTGAGRLSARKEAAKARRAKAVRKKAAPARKAAAKKSGATRKARKKSSGKPAARKKLRST